jgi:hypothetical protein
MKKVIFAVLLVLVALPIGQYFGRLIYWETARVKVLSEMMLYQNCITGALLAFAVLLLVKAYQDNQKPRVVPPTAK